MSIFSKHRKLANQINLIFLLFLFFPIICLTFFLVLFYTEKIERDSIDDINNHLKIISYIYQNEEDEIKHLVQKYSHKKVITFLLNLEVGEKIGIALAKSAEFDGIDMITILDRSGKVLVRSHNPKKINDILPLKQTKNLFNGTVLAGIEILTKIELDQEGIDIKSFSFENDTNILAVTGSYPIYDKEQKNVVGVIVLRRMLDNQSKLMKKINELENLTVALFDNNNIVSINKKTRYFVHPSQNIINKVLQYNTPFHNINSGTISKYLAIEGINEKSSAILMIQKNLDEYLYSRNIKILELTIIAFFIFFLGFTIRSILKRQILTPIKKLKNKSDQLANGKKIEILKIKSWNELGELTNAFNNMAIVLKTTEENLRESEKKFRGLFENSIEGIFQTTIENGFINVNKSMAKKFGFESPEEMMSTITDIGQQCYSNPEKKKEINKIIEKQNQISGIEAQYKRKDGTLFWGAESVRAVSDSDGKLKYYEGTLIDITERKAKEKAQRERDAAELANQAKSQFLANMSHEIRTPLNSLLGFNELLSMELDDPRQKNYIDSMKIAGNSLLTLINDILDLSKIEAGKMVLNYEPVNLELIFSEIKDIFNEEITRKGIQFVINLDEKLSTYLILDESRIRQILLNLVGNAAKFTENGMIKLTAKKLATRNLEMIDLVIKVEDTGCGIKKKDLESIFESFKQVEDHANKKSVGTGLGLAICKRLTEAMNGQIKVTSESGVGSTFTISLNNVKISSDNNLKKDNNGSEIDFTLPSFEKKIILIVDDIELNLQMLKTLLIKFGQDVLVANNGKEAIAMVKEGDPDLIIMDIRMPVMDGNQATKLLKSNPHTKTIPVIAFTGDVVDLNKIGALKNGYDGYLTKPVKIHELIIELSKFINVAIPDQEISRQDLASDTLVPEDVLNPDELIIILKEDILALYKVHKNSIIINQIKEFSKLLNSLGEKHQVPQLRSFGDDLTGYANLFDIVKITKKMEELPSLIEQLIGKLKK